MGSKDISTRNQTIEDFDFQWSTFGAIGKRDGADFVNSREILEDIISGVLDLQELEGKKVCEVGCGHGRLIRQLQKYRPAVVYAVEPGPNALAMARSNLSAFDNVEYINARGDEFSVPKVNFMYSVGVLHHIPDPVPVIDNIYRHLEVGGRFVFWVYGKEGNRVYLLLYRFLSLFTRSMNSKALFGFCYFMALFTYPYGWLCRLLPLPLRSYFTNLMNRIGLRNRALIIFDQLNPAFAKYYSQRELTDLMASTEFRCFEKCVHRHGYSWTVLCRR